MKTKMKLLSSILISIVWLSSVNAQNFKNELEWNVTTSLPNGVYAHESILFNNYIYVIGGDTSTIPTNEVLFAEILNDGSLSEWEYTTSLPLSIQNFACVLHENYIYVIGGYTNEGESNKVYFSEINTNGTLNNWVETSSFFNSRYENNGFVNNNYIYTLGGLSGDDIMGDVQYSQINSDGSLNTWSYTQELTSPRQHFDCASNNGYVYIFGANGELDEVLFAHINSDGTVDQWVNTTPMPYIPRYHATVISNNKVFVTAGGSTAVIWSEINSDGSLGQWNSITSLDFELTEHSSVITDDYLYILGGYHEDNGYVIHEDVLYTSISSIAKIDDFSSKRDIEIYPNPTKGKFTIKMNNQNRKTLIEVTNITGQVFFKKKYNPGCAIEQIDLTGLAAGIYIVKMHVDNYIKTEKIVIE